MKRQKYTHINLAYLTAMAAGDNSFVIEMITEYKLRVPSYINELLLAVTEGNLEEVRFVAHKLSSSLQIVGAHDLVEITHKIEEMSLDDKNILDNIVSETKKMTPLYKEVEKELNEELAILK